MAIIATPARRRIVMGVLLGLAVAGAVMRVTAPDPSVLRDVGTLLLVLWLPAVGNLVAWLVRKLPRKAPRGADFAAGSVFTEHLQAEVEVYALPADVLARFDARDPRCMVIVPGQGFTARLPAPAVQALAEPGTRALSLEFLRPVAALEKLPPGTPFHLLLGGTAAGKGRVLRHGDAEPAS